VAQKNQGQVHQKGVKNAEKGTSCEKNGQLKRGELKTKKRVLFERDQ